MFIEEMEATEVINQTRAYLDYLEEHIDNVRKAFQEVSEACEGMPWVGDDLTWHTIRHEVAQHDLSKFSKEEFTQYRAKFYPTKGEQPNKDDFKLAWKHHVAHNVHHHEAAKTENDIVHMVVDWTAMGYKFGDTAEEYYFANESNIPINIELRVFLLQVLNNIRNNK